MLREPRLHLVRISRVSQMQTLAGSNTGVDFAGCAPLFTLETERSRRSDYVDGGAG